MFPQEMFEIRDGDAAGVKHACGQGTVDMRFIEHCGEMLRRTRATGRNQRHMTQLPHRRELLEVVPLADPIARHAIQHDFARATILNFAYPVERAPRRVACAIGITGELIDVVLVARDLAIDADDDTLRTEARAQTRDEFGIGESRGVDRHFFRAFAEHFFRICDGTNSASHAERNVENARDAANPAAIDGASIGARGDVVEHELVRAFVAIACCKLENVADDDVIAKAHAFDDLPVSYVKAGDDAFGKNGRNS